MPETYTVNKTNLELIRREIMKALSTLRAAEAMIQDIRLENTKNEQS